MILTRFLVLVSLFLLHCARAGVLRRRAVLPHTEIQPVPQAVRSGVLGDLLRKYQPALRVDRGCVPYPAVDVNENVSAGLEPEGLHNTNCTSSNGQVYIRTVLYSPNASLADRRALLYAWYMPKDSPSPPNGHRHSWKYVIVWLDSADNSFVGMAIPEDGNVSFRYGNSIPKSDDHPLLRYYSRPFGSSHRLGFTNTRGSLQPMFDWGSMGAGNQRALDGSDWGEATFPLADEVLCRELEKAWITWVPAGRRIKKWPTGNALKCF